MANEGPSPVLATPGQQLLREWAHTRGLTISYTADGSMANWDALAGAIDKALGLQAQAAEEQAAVVQKLRNILAMARMEADRLRGMLDGAKDVR